MTPILGFISSPRFWYQRLHRPLLLHFHDSPSSSTTEKLDSPGLMKEALTPSTAGLCTRFCQRRNPKFTREWSAVANASKSSQVESAESSLVLSSMRPWGTVTRGHCSSCFSSKPATRNPTLSGSLREGLVKLQLLWQRLVDVLLHAKPLFQV